MTSGSWSRDSRSISSSALGTIPLRPSARVVPSCACSSALLDRQHLGPGEEGTLDVRVDTAARPGKLDVSVAVCSEAPAQEIIIFRVLARIGRSQALEIEPSRLDFGLLAPGSRVEKTVQVSLKSRWGKPIPTVSEVAVDDQLEEWVEASFEPGTALQADGDYLALAGTLRIAMRADFSETISGLVRVKCYDEETPLSAQVAVTGSLRGPFSLSDTSIFFDDVAPGSRCTAKLSVTWLDSDRPEDLSVSTTEEWLSVNLVRDRSEGHTNVEVVALAPQPGFHTSQVVVSSKLLELRVPVKLYAR